MNEEVIEQNPIRIYIYRYYTPNMQTEDSTWKNYWTTLLKAKGAENLEADIVGRVVSLKEGKSLAEVLEDVVDELKPAYAKLVKIGARSAWAFDTIQEFLAAANENREPNKIPFPTFED